MAIYTSPEGYLVNEFKQYVDQYGRLSATPVYPPTAQQTTVSQPVVELTPFVDGNILFYRDPMGNIYDSNRKLIKAANTIVQNALKPVNIQGKIYQVDNNGNLYDINGKSLGNQSTQTNPYAACNTQERQYKKKVISGTICYEDQDHNLYDANFNLISGSGQTTSAMDYPKVNNPVQTSYPTATAEQTQSKHKHKVTDLATILDMQRAKSQQNNVKTEITPEKTESEAEVEFDVVTVDTKENTFNSRMPFASNLPTAYPDSDPGKLDAEDGVKAKKDKIIIKRNSDIYTTLDRVEWKALITKFEEIDATLLVKEFIGRIEALDTTDITIGKQLKLLITDLWEEITGKEFTSTTELFDSYTAVEVQSYMQMVKFKLRAILYKAMKTVETSEGINDYIKNHQDKLDQAVQDGDVYIKIIDGEKELYYEVLYSYLAEPDDIVHVQDEYVTTRCDCDKQKLNIKDLNIITTINLDDVKYTYTVQNESIILKLHESNSSIMKPFEKFNVLNKILRQHPISNAMKDLNLNYTTFLKDTELFAEINSVLEDVIIQCNGKHWRLVFTDGLVRIK